MLSSDMLLDPDWPGAKQRPGRAVVAWLNEGQRRGFPRQTMSQDAIALGRAKCKDEWPRSFRTWPKHCLSLRHTSTRNQCVLDLAEAMPRSVSLPTAGAGQARPGSSTRIHTRLHWLSGAARSALLPHLSQLRRAQAAPCGAPSSWHPIRSLRGNANGREQCGATQIRTDSQGERKQLDGISFCACA